MRLKYTILALLMVSMSALAQDSVQTFLSLKPTGVEEFLKKHPNYDGRGTIIFILDTGVDMGIDGLKTTPTGETKVIDVRDFTGEGDLEMFEARTEKDNGSVVLKNEENKLSVKGLDRLALKAVDDKYFIGNFDEERFKNSNSSQRDLNGNGKFDDNYIFIVFKTKDNAGEYWAAYFDTNLNGDVSDEKPIRSYREKFDTFQIPNTVKMAPFNFAINIFPEEKKLNVFYDDGGHGTHVAGIASGYQIGREKFFNGVAPGSKLIALKIGHNTMSGGATVTQSMEKAYLYADELSKKLKEPCIINMSFGIGSVIEGNSDIELFLADLLSKNPYLYVCLSNGNEGPGISSTGLPSSSRYAFSSGAVLTQDVGRDVYGTVLDGDIVLHFSSRGGEVAKPDVVSPGACVSTVTNWSSGDKMWGTSMASPYSAGVMSLLLSAVREKYPEIKIPSQLLFKAVRQGAVKLKDYNLLDQGAGYINADNAFDLLEKYIKDKEYNNFEDYTVSVFSPGMPEGKAQCLYLRNGSVITNSDGFTFNISRSNSNASDKFHRIYNLKSDSDWLISVQKKTYIRNQQGTNVTVRFDKTKLEKSGPGVYTGKISAYRDDKTKFPEFDLQASIILPYEFNRENNYSLNFANESLMAGKHKRYFVNIPAGASIMTVKFSSPMNKYCKAVYRLFDPEGVNIYTSPLLNSAGSEQGLKMNHQNLKAGVYELVVHGYFTAAGLSYYNLNVDISGVNPVHETVEINKTENLVPIKNYLDQVKSFMVSGKVLGYRKDFTAEFNGTDKYVYPFVIRKGETSKQFVVNMSKEDFNKFTDFSLLIYDESGKAILKDGLNYSNGAITISNSFGEADSTRLRFELVPAFANKAGKATVKITELTTAADPVDFEVESNNSSQVELYPSAEKTLKCSIEEPKFSYPKDAHPYGNIYLKLNGSDVVELELPFIYK